MDRLKKYNQQLNIMVYVVDDEEDTLNVVKEELEKAGFENCKYLTSSNDFINRLDEPIHICILDFYFPGMDGIEILDKVRERNKDCYVIGFSGLSDPKKIRSWFNAGLRKLVDKNESNALSELIRYVKDAINSIKDDFDWHASLLRKIESYEAKVSNYESNTGL